KRRNDQTPHAGNVLDHDPLRTSLSSCFLFFDGSLPHRHLHSFPTRRSSDLVDPRTLPSSRRAATSPRPTERSPRCDPTRVRCTRDRKSTRLNSSHSQISYAVFCLKKKKTQTQSVSKHKMQATHVLLSYLLHV